jgi:hypothetical protein
MSKDETETDESKWTYDGNEEEWDNFDRKMTRHMLKKYDVFGERMWLKDIPKLEDLDYRTAFLTCAPHAFFLCSPHFFIGLPFCLLRIRKLHKIAEKWT